MTRSSCEETPEVATANRRRFPRFVCPPEASVRLQSGVVSGRSLGVPARLLDLGLGGALVESSTRLTPGSVTVVTIENPNISFRAQARFKRAFLSRFASAADREKLPLYQAGLEFGPLSPSEAGAVRAFVSEAARATRRRSDDSCPDEDVDHPVLRLPPQLAKPAPGRAILVTPDVSPGVEPESTADRSDGLVSIRFPPGWVMTRRKGAVVASAPDQRGYVLLGARPGPQSRDVCEFARAWMRDFSVLHSEPAKINGWDACIGFYTGWLDDLGAVLIEAAHMRRNNQAYLIAGVAPWAAYETVRHEFFATIHSFGAVPTSDGACIVASFPSGPADGFDFTPPTR